MVRCKSTNSWTALSRHVNRLKFEITSSAELPEGRDDGGKYIRDADAIRNSITHQEERALKNLSEVEILLSKIMKDTYETSDMREELRKEMEAEERGEGTFHLRAFLRGGQDDDQEEDKEEKDEKEEDRAQQQEDTESDDWE